jgi:hypothetical protein
LPDCQIEFVLPNRIAESKCRIVKLNSFCQIKLRIEFGKIVWQTIFRQIYVLQNGLPNLNAKSIWQTIQAILGLAKWFGKPFCRI